MTPKFFGCLGGRCTLPNVREVSLRRRNICTSGMSGTREESAKVSEKGFVAGFPQYQFPAGAIAKRVGAGAEYGAVLRWLDWW